ncbi:MAG: hypothetical protein U0Q16_30860 [Bryobacteraceae bacterium]
MPASIRNNVLLKDFIKREREEGRAEGLAEARAEVRAQAREEGRKEGSAETRSALMCSLLEEKFGPLPGWVRDRVCQASGEQVNMWVRKVLKVRSLEGVFGRK